MEWYQESRKVFMEDHVNVMYVRPRRVAYLNFKVKQGNKARVVWSV